MSIDLKHIKTAKLAALLNSTRLGEVTSEARLRRNVIKAGLRVSDGRTINVVAYAAWLLQNWHQRYSAVQSGGLTGYEARKERERARFAQMSASGRDIGDLPAVVNPDRKERASRDFRFFCEAYFPQTFRLAWSDDHLKIIAKIEQAVLRGGLFAMAMPRGSGKTTLAETACLWAILIGARDFVCLVGSDKDHAINMLDSIRTECEVNELLLEDYPEAIYPIQCLERIANRAKGQTYHGLPTRINWVGDEIVMPTIQDSAASGAIIRVAGIEGRIRGMKYKRADGRSVRPSLVIIDDPQTDESARSPIQIKARMETLNGAILNLAGPGQKISGIMPCTVIRPADLADQILDRDKHPQWQGERTKMVYAFPIHEALWSKYAQLRSESFKNDGDGSEATEFYRQNRAAMDEGAVIAWPQRHNTDELSAIQHAMNLKLQDEAAFFAEYQNEPIPEQQGDADLLTAEQIAEKFNGLSRGQIPIGCNHLTMFIDVQGKALFYAVAAWEDDFTGYIVDYGTWPDQKQPYFTLRNLTRTLTSVSSASGMEGIIYEGLDRLTSLHLSRQWRRDDGAYLTIERCLIDANWGQSTDVVYKFCRQSPHTAVLLPSHGKFVGASSIPFSEYVKKRGDRVGHHWRIPCMINRRAIRHVLIDTNYWKSFIQARLSVAMGDPGCLSLFGKTSRQHQLFSEHLTAEYCIRTEGRGRIVDEWKIRAGSPDNHWLDCIVGCAVGASIQGAVLFAADSQHRSRVPLKLSEIQQRRRCEK
ncbi:terminase gpA endonuclease subunit [Anaerohalosphaeraceae bacterium U12dextr]|jgi:hypothetical protein